MGDFAGVGDEGGRSTDGWAPIDDVPDEAAAGTAADGPAASGRAPAEEGAPSQTVQSALASSASTVPPASPALVTQSLVSRRSMPRLFHPAVWIVGAMATVLLMGSLFIWSVTGRGQADETDQPAPPDPVQVLRSEGERVVNALDELKETEQRLVDELVAYGRHGSGDSTLVAYEDISCWYSYGAGQDEPSEVARCGPVVFADSVVGTHWLELPLRFIGRPGGEQVQIGLPESRRTTGLATGERLWRPDGEAAPSPDDIDLERPSVAAAPGSAVYDLLPHDLMITPTQPDDGLLTGSGFTTEIIGYGTTDRMTVISESPIGPDVYGATPEVFGAPGEVRAAPIGQEWLIFELQHDLQRWSDVPEPVHSLEVDGTTYPVTLHWVAGNDGAGGTFGVLVPEGTDEVTLVVADGGMELRRSFGPSTTGDGSGPSVLTRDPETRLAAGATVSVPYTATDDLGDGGATSGDLTLRVDEAHLDYTVEVETGLVTGNANVQQLTADAPDRALLYLAHVEVSWSSINDIPHDVDADQIELVLEDGTVAEPWPMTNDRYDPALLTDLDDPGNYYPVLGLTQLPVWNVPADIERATLRLTPHDDEPDDLTTYDYQGASIDLTLNFGG